MCHLPPFRPRCTFFCRVSGSSPLRFAQTPALICTIQGIVLKSLPSPSHHLLDRFTQSLFCCFLSVVILHGLVAFADLPRAFLRFVVASVDHWRIQSVETTPKHLSHLSLRLFCLASASHSFNYRRPRPRLPVFCTVRPKQSSHEASPHLEHDSSLFTCQRPCHNLHLLRLLMLTAFQIVNRTNLPPSTSDPPHPQQIRRRRQVKRKSTSTRLQDTYHGCFGAVLSINRFHNHHAADTLAELGCIPRWNTEPTAPKIISDAKDCLQCTHGHDGSWQLSWAHFSITFCLLRLQPTIHHPNCRQSVTSTSDHATI